ncbi:MAG: O-acetylhomoserine aminocarboxypropyltransferase/cysteine synthase [Kiritimatiellae bacterium]|jgi:O-acetylhomoserine (thiol)-lyase|nr:O-acetylhomoserine aminocarboxypropyltransferase/cysteine synthase [Kiritimatiellia bacterium]
MTDPDWSIETKTIQCGYRPKNSEPNVLPLVQSTTYKYDTASDVAKLFDLDAATHMYSRLSNPTVECLENKIASLEGGVGAVATCAGQAANFLAVFNICNVGEHVVASTTIYGGTYNLFYHTFKKMGIEVTFVDQNSSEEDIKKAFRPNTKALFGETLSNPSARILDLEKFVRIAKDMDVPFIVDNTFPTPFLCRPFEFGVDIVTHSTTKYLDGHATSLGGVVVDSGNYNWNNGKFPCLTEPDPSYHGDVYNEKFGNLGYLVKMRAQMIRDFGNIMAPMNAFLTNLGTETLHLRMERHSFNALKLAQYLESHPEIEWVKYPGLESSPDYELHKKYLPLGCSGVFTCGIKGDAERVEGVMNSLKLARILVHVGDLRTCVLHPATMTHRQLSAEELEIAGISPNLIRVSVGIENVDDIIADFEQALK